MDTSKISDNISKITTVLVVIGVLSLAAIYFIQIAINEAYADGILSDVMVRAEQRRNNLSIKNSPSEDEIKNYIDESRIGHRGYMFTILDDSTTSLVKVETAKKPVSAGICRALKEKFQQAQWMGLFDKVMILDRMGNEKLDITINSCPHQEIPILRFYVRFAPDEKVQVVIDETEEYEASEETVSEESSEPLPAPTPTPSSDFNTSPNVSYTRPNVPAPSRPSISCPAGTSIGGAGGIATSGCRCNRSGEFWNGHSCELKPCPSGSSRSGTGDLTTTSGCRCELNTPLWSGGHCMAKCAGNKILMAGECVCPAGMVVKKDTPDQCVECNETSDCFLGHICSNGKCVEAWQDDPNDCRWGICQTCDENNVHANILNPESCEVAGLHGVCNGNGTCYPTEGKPCSSIHGCAKGEFCNYGGIYNSSKKQRGKFGRTPNVCQVVNPQEFTYKKITYYYNSKKDLQSWCRAANNKANCLWGYLSKLGAQSWCASLGKRLLTRDEMASVWDVLKDELPQTYTGYAYWVQEGAWIVGKTGKNSFTKAYADGYGGKGGVVCK